MDKEFGKASMDVILIKVKLDWTRDMAVEAGHFVNKDGKESSSMASLMENFLDICKSNFFKW